MGSGSCAVDEKWLFDPGALHDAKVVKHIKTGTDVAIFIDDEWSNFEGFDEYPGAQSGALIVSDALSCPDFSPIANELLLDVELLRTSEEVSLKFHALGHPVIEISGQNVFWTACSPISDKTFP